jgi:hypothetical protein
MILYCLVVVETRYLGAYFTLFWLALLPAVRLPDHPRSRALCAAAVIGMLLPLGCGLARGTARDMLHPSDGDLDWQAATGLAAMGLHAGDRVGCIGVSWDHGWAYLAQVTVVAEIPTGNEQGFWRASPRIRAAVLRAFSRAGARAVVTEQPPAGTKVASGWRRVGHTDRYVRLLDSVPPGLSARLSARPFLANVPRGPGSGISGGSATYRNGLTLPGLPDRRRPL